MAVSMLDIARRAGVSMPAVSAVLRGSSQTTRVSPERAELIRRIAKELGYRKQWRSSAMRDGRTHLVGLVGTADRITKLHNPLLLRGLEDELAANHLALTFVQTGPGNDDVLTDGRFDGCLIDFVVLPEQIAAIKEVGLPGVIINAEPREGIPAVRLDERAAMQACVTHLLELGHRRICYVDAVPDSIVAQRWGGELQRRRRLAWDAARESAGDAGVAWSTVGIPTVVYVDPAEAVRKSGLRDVLTRAADRRPTAFVCYDATLAFLVADITDRVGLRCPADLSVVSMSDGDLLRLWRTPISAINEDFAELGRQSVRRLGTMIEQRVLATAQEKSEPARPATRSIPRPAADADARGDDQFVCSPFVDRESTAPPPPAEGGG